MTQRRIGWPEIFGRLTGAALGVVSAAAIWFAWGFIKRVFTEQLNHQTPQDQPAGQASPTSPLKLNDVLQDCPLLTLLLTPAL